MRAVRKFLARHVWLLFLLIVACFVGVITFIVKFPTLFLGMVMGAGIGALLYVCVGFCFITTYWLYMKWSLEE